MRLYRVLVLLMACGLMAGACRRVDERTFVIDVPAMKNEACARVAAYAVAAELSRPEDGGFQGRIQEFVRSGHIVADLQRRTLTVRFDSLKGSLKNIEFAIANAGFQANDVPANEAAAKALPAECR